MAAAVAADGVATLVRERRISNAEEVILGRAIDLLDTPPAPGAHRHRAAGVIEEGPDMLRSAARTDTPQR